MTKNGTTAALYVFGTSYTRRTNRTDQIDQIDHDLEHLDPHLPLWDVRDLCSTDPTQEICAMNRSCRWHGSHPGKMRANGSYLVQIRDVSSLNDLDHVSGDRWSVRGVNYNTWNFYCCTCRLGYWDSFCNTTVKDVYYLVPGTQEVWCDTRTSSSLLFYPVAKHVQDAWCVMNDQSIIIRTVGRTSRLILSTMVQVRTCI